MSTKKVYFSLNDTMLEKLDKIANSYGVTRSAYIAMVIGQNVSAVEKTLDCIPQIINDSISQK